MGKSFNILLLLLIFFLSKSISQAQDCDTCNSTVTIYVDLSLNSDSVWISPDMGRLGLCCSAPSNYSCIRFYITVHPDADQLSFTLATPPIPPGQEYQVECGPLMSVGTPMCISGTGPHCIVYCKPGGDILSYQITSAKTLEASPDIIVSQGCVGKIWAVGLEETSIIWNTIYPGVYGEYNSYLSCQSGCDTTFATAQPGFPPYIDIEVSGNLLAPCNFNSTKDTVRIYFVNDKAVTISPQDPVICFGGTPATLTANPVGGAPPYNYLWNTGETTQSITVTAQGNYWVEVSDQTTDCPSVYDTVYVTEFSLPITAHAGIDQTICYNNPIANLNGNVEIATGGIWGGGNGIFLPDNTSLNATYVPTADELTSGVVSLTLTTTGNFGCPLDVDYMQITISPSPTVSAGTDLTVCTNNLNASMSGSVTNATGGIWTGGTGTFNPLNTTLNAVYTPSEAEITAGNVVLTLTTTGVGNCYTVSDSIEITIIPEPIVDAGLNQTICANNSLVNLNGSYSLSLGSMWFSSGNGNFSPNNTSLTPTYTPSPEDIANGAVVLGLISTGNGVCLPNTDFTLITILPSPVVDAGNNQVLCSNNSDAILAGTVTGPTTTGIWSSNGTGYFYPSEVSLNATYVPSPQDTSIGSVTIKLTSTNNISCLPVSDSLTLTYTPSPTLISIIDVAICANNPDITLTTNLSISTGVSWTSTGTGFFSPNAFALSPTYFPSLQDTGVGQITLMVVSTGNGNCLPVTDQVAVTITPAPVVFAGTDTILCNNTSGFQLSGIVYGGSHSGVWNSSGNGIYNPSDTVLNAIYIPGSSDLVSGSSTMILTSTENGNCIPVSDTLQILYMPPPIVNAGPNQSVCANNATTVLSGIIQNTNVYFWETNGSGYFSPDANSSTVIYYPSMSDTANEYVNISLNAANGCAFISDTMTLSFTPGPIVYAGQDQSICATETQVALTGFVSAGSATGNWSSSGTGYFYPSADYLNTNYIPSPTDTSAGSVTINLTSTNNGSCLSETDQLIITFEFPPVVQLNGDNIICSGENAILNAQIMGGSGNGIWTTPNGTGVFQPSNTSLNVTYIPSVQDISNGNVMIVFTTFGSSCLPASGVINLTILPPPAVNAGLNQVVCKNNATINLSASITNAPQTGYWSVNGTGVFNPGTQYLNSSYIPSQEDLASGSLLFTFTSTGGCDSISDNLSVVFTLAPVVNAGTDQVICVGVTSVSIEGSVSGGASYGLWTTTGSGNFAPSSTSLSGTYNLSSADTSIGNFYLILTSTNNGNCLPVSDSIQILITPPPFVTVGTDQTVCANTPVQLNGNITGGSGTGVWTSSGTGSFIPNNTSLNSQYIFSQQDTSLSSVTLTLSATQACLNASDALIVNITSAPIAFAGNDLILCNTNSTVFFSGTMSSWAMPIIWTSTGTGIFLPDNISLNGTYTPSAADISAGTIHLILSSTNNANCQSAIDTLTVQFITAPNVIADSDHLVCVANPIQLNGIITGGSGSVQWITPNGTGTFITSDTLTTAFYQPSVQDTANGSVSFIFSSTNNGNCQGASDFLTISFQQWPQVYAGPDQTACANNGTIQLMAESYYTSGSLWNSSGDGIFLPSAGTLNATYTPGSIDQINGLVSLQVITTQLGDCPQGKDTLLLYLTPSPFVNAGEDRYICPGVSSVNLNGIISGPTNTGAWSTLGSGSFLPDTNTLNAIYLLSPEDTTVGYVNLVLTSTNNNNCLPVTDTIKISITGSPSVNAGDDFSVCKNNASINLSGNIIDGELSNISWTATNGSGIFAPSANSLTTTYTPSTGDLQNNYIDFILLTIQTCHQHRDTIRVTLTPSPIVNAGSDIYICEDATILELSGQVSIGATTGVWTSEGNGIFSNPELLITDYFIAANDPLLQSMNIVLTSTLNGNCLPVSDTLEVLFGNKPLADFTYTSPVCINSLATFTDASIITGDSIVSWLWTFGTNETDTGSQSTFSYNVPGNTNISLIVTTSLGCKDTVVKNLSVLVGPFVSFTTSPNCLQDSVYFTNLSSTAVSWLWDFGNGNTSALENPPAQIYDTIQNYMASLTITDALGCVSSKTDTVFINPSPISNFLIEKICVNQPIQLIENSSVLNDTIISWHWDLGDGTLSNLQNPLHSYTSTDSVTIQLVVATNFCTDTFSLRAAPYPSPTFTAFPEMGCSPMFVQFTTDTLPGNMYQWSFGDGQVSSQAQPDHIFYNNSASDTIFWINLVVATTHGCVDSAINPVIIYPSPNANFTFSPQNSCSPALISIQNTSTGAAYYSWIFSDSVSLTNVQNPSYTFINTSNQTQYFPILLTAISENGCSDSIKKYVPVFANPEFEISLPDDSMCHPGIASITCTPEAMNYQWFFGDNSFVSGGNQVQHIYTNYGTNDITYTITLIASSYNGCIDTSYKNIVIHPSPVALFNVSPNFGCSPLNATITNQSSGATEFIWNFGDNNTDTNSNSIINHTYYNTTSGQISYTVHLTAISLNGCTGTATRSVSLYPVVTSAFSSDTMGCSPFTANFTNQSQYATMFYWDFGDASFSTNQNPSHTFLNNTSSETTFNAYLISESPFGCKDTSEIKEITVYPQPQGNLTLNATSGCSPFFCSINNFSTGATGYTWNFGDGTFSSDTGNIINHIYFNTSGDIDNYVLSVLLTNDFGCADTLIESITVFPMSEANFEADTTGCSPLTISFNNLSSNSSSYQWLFGEGNTSTNSNPVHTFYNTGINDSIFTVSLITNSSFGCKDTLSKNIFVHPQPIANIMIPVTTSCSPFTVELINNTENVSQFFWNFGDGTTSTTTDFISSHNYTNNTNTPHTYNISVITENTFLCHDTLNQTITIYPGISVSYSPLDTSGCSPLTVNYQNHSQNVITYNWFFADGGVSGVASPSHTFINPNTYTISYATMLVAKSNFGCSDTVLGNVTVYPSPNANFSVSPTFQYYPDTAVTINNLTQGINWTYLWDFGDGATSTIAQPISHSYTGWGEHQILLTVTLNSCTDTIAQTIVIAATIPVADYDSSYIGCSPLKVIFKNKSIGATWYQWDFGDGGTSSEINPSYTYFIPGSYTVQLTAGNFTGQNISRKHTITVHEKPDAFFRVSPPMVEIPDQYLYCHNLSFGGESYIWYFGDGFHSTEFEPTHLYTQEGNFNITLFVTSEHGCLDTMVEPNAATAISTCKLIFPTAFTPNTAGSNGGYYEPHLPELTNDIFHPVSQNITEYHLEIFNRWGELIFTSDDLKIGWDGYYRNVLCKPDVFIWKVSAKCLSGRMINEIGSVTLVR